MKRMLRQGMVVTPLELIKLGNELFIEIGSINQKCIVPIINKQPKC